MVELFLKFDVRLLEAKNRVFEFDYQKMNTMFKKDDVQVRLMIYLVNLVMAYLVRSFKAKNWVFEFDHQ